MKYYLLPNPYSHGSEQNKIIELIFKGEFYNHFCTSIDYYDDSELKHFINLISSKSTETEKFKQIPSLLDDYSLNKNGNFLVSEFHNVVIKVYKLKLNHNLYI